MTGERFMDEDRFARVPPDVREAIQDGDLRPRSAADVNIPDPHKKILRLFYEWEGKASPQQRRIMQLRYGENLTHAQIAARLGVARATVSVQIARFMRKIRRSA